jgi:phospholipase C
MQLLKISKAALLMIVLVTVAGQTARSEGDPHKVKHVIVIMQENHSFDNYFGALAYTPGSPYHTPGNDDRDKGDGGCPEGDHKCVDGLTCHTDKAGEVICVNNNRDDGASIVFSFHDSRRCVAPDLDHEWASTHREANFNRPNDTLFQGPMDGFVRINDQTEQIDNGVENATEDQTMAFYNQNEIPFYYDLAQKFALNDRYFGSVLGPTFPNRSYLMAATSFGHLTTSDSFPPPGSTGYKPITGTIFDLMEKQQVTWADYFSDVPQGGSFRQFSLTSHDPHFVPLALFLAQVAGAPGLPALPQVAFVDPNFGILSKLAENDEHPPTDIQRGQALVSQVVNKVRNGPYWKDTVILFTYDEHGGFYDHVQPPRARQDRAPNPDGINPGQCEDLSNPPASLQPGGGAECSTNLLKPADSSVANAASLCPEFAKNPTGPFPAGCANFDQYGVRVPFMAISPFSRPGYVSHTVGDHTSILALIETVFMTPASASTGRDDDDDNVLRPHLTKRDRQASALLDMFDFTNAPSLNTNIGAAAPPTTDCTPH